MQPHENSSNTFLLSTDLMQILVSWHKGEVICIMLKLSWISAEPVQSSSQVCYDLFPTATSASDRCVAEGNRFG